MKARPYDVEKCRTLTRNYVVVQDDNGCWHLAGKSADSGGYVRLTREQLLAHRVFKVASLGRDILPGHVVDHTCHNSAIESGECAGGVCLHRSCVNPKHLTEVTHKENILGVSSTLASINSRKTVCAAGHPLVDIGRGKRGCPECNRSNVRKHATRYNEARRAAARRLGLTVREYGKQYGWSYETALAVIQK